MNTVINIQVPQKQEISLPAEQLKMWQEVLWIMELVIGFSVV
jgi:hypothetical protein